MIFNKSCQCSEAWNDCCHLTGSGSISFVHLRFYGYFSLSIGTLFLGKLNEFLPYSKGCNPIYMSIAFKDLMKNNSSTEDKKTSSNGLNEKICIKSPTFIPSVNVLLLSQLLCVPRLLSPKPASDGYSNKGPESRLLRNWENSEREELQAQYHLWGSKQECEFNRKHQGSQPCTVELFTFCPLFFLLVFFSFFFFCQTVIKKKERKTENNTPKQPKFWTMTFLCFCHQSSKNSSLRWEKDLEKWRFLPPLYICPKHTLKSCYFTSGHIWHYTEAYR